MKKTFTFLTVLFMATSLVAQTSMQKPKNSSLVSTSEIRSAKASKGALVNANKVAITQTMYIDYSAINGISSGASANGDDLFYVWRFNSGYIDTDTALSFVGVSLNQIAGYSDPANIVSTYIDSSILGFPQRLSDEF